MSKTGIAALSIVAFLVLGAVGSYAVGTTNRLVEANQEVNQTYAQVQNVLQRQANLIPSLVETVKGAAQFESSTLTKVIEARNWAARPIILVNGKACSVVSAPTEVVPPGVTGPATERCDPSVLANDPNAQRQLAEASNAMMNVNVNALREQYPQLKTSEMFVTLMSQLEGSVNRITVERRRNQLAVRDYNVDVLRFPASMIASRQGYREKPYYEAEAAAQSGNPNVKFDWNK